VVHEILDSLLHLIRVDAHNECVDESFQQFDGNEIYRVILSQNVSLRLRLLYLRISATMRVLESGDNCLCIEKWREFQRIIVDLRVRSTKL